MRDDEPRTLRRISDELSLEISTVNRQVHAAVRDGHLERLDAKEGAAHLYGRTEAGRAAYDDVAQRRRARYAAALESLGDEDAQQFVELFERFVEAFER